MFDPTMCWWWVFLWVVLLYLVAMTTVLFKLVTILIYMHISFTRLLKLILFGERLSTTTLGSEIQANLDWVPFFFFRFSIPPRHKVAMAEQPVSAGQYLRSCSLNLHRLLLTNERSFCAYTTYHRRRITTTSVVGWRKHVHLLCLFYVSMSISV